MKVVDHETSKEENQKWGNIARIRAIDPDFNAVIEALEKEANEKIEVKKVEVEGLMRDVNREYKKEVSKIESQYMKEKQEIDEKHRNKVLEQYEVWIQKKHGNSIYKKLKEQRYFISLRQYLISKWLEEKGVDWDPFEEKKSDEKLREDYNIEAEVVLDDAIKPLRERLYRILDILLGKVISLQEGILKVRDKSLKGKKGYITFARTKEGMFICGDGESSVIKGIQARVLVGKEVLADCYWTEKEGINLCPITFSTYTDDENDQIIGSVFIQGGSMKSPVITDSFKDIKPDAEYKIMVHVWNNDFGYLWTNINRPNGLTRIDYLIMSGGWGQENPVQNLVEQCYFKKGSVEETSHEQI